MRVPKRVRIVANNETDDNGYYDQFIGNEYEVESTWGTDVVLKIKSADGKHETTDWRETEYEVLEWEEIDD